MDAAVRVDHAREEDVQHRAAAVVGAASLALASLLEAELRLLVLDAVLEIFVGLLLRAPDTSRLRLLHEAVLHRLGVGSLGLTLAQPLPIQTWRAKIQTTPSRKKQGSPPLNKKKGRAKN